MEGFLNVNKAPGMTSFAVIKKLKKIFPRTKLGHLGTLDPMAQGVLPVAIGCATRVIEYVRSTDKVYLTTMTLGGVSDTQDAWGNIVYQPVIDFDEAQLPAILDAFTGLIRQIPPMYSAVHYQGERLYKLARQGITVEREAREIMIEYIKVTAITRDDEGRPLINLEVGCSQGTYIRTLCHDIGQELGTGAYMSSLTRIQVGDFVIERAHTLGEIEAHADNLDPWIDAVDYPLQHLERVTVGEDSVAKILNGNRVFLEVKPFTDRPVRVYDGAGRLLAIGHYMSAGTQTALQPVKVFG